MIHYPGTEASLSDVISGRVPVMFQTLLPVAGVVASGDVKLLAVAAPKRLPNYPDLPSVAETLPGFTASGWSILVAPHWHAPSDRAKNQRRSAKRFGAAGAIEEVPGAWQLHALNDAAGACRFRTQRTAGMGADR